MQAIAEPPIIDKGGLIARLIETDEHMLETARQLCRNSLRYLCTKFLGYFSWGQVHDDVVSWINTELEKPTEGKRILFILIPRGHLKTSIITIGFTIQQVLRNPNIRILISNAVWDMSRSFLSEITEFFRSKSMLPKLFGSFETDRFNRDEVTIRQRTAANKTPTISTAGIESAKTGQHYDLIIGDDLVNRQNVENETQRDKVHLYYKDLLDLLEPNGTAIFIGTRWHDDDLYGRKIREGKAAANQKDRPSVYVRKVVEEGKFIFPEKFNQTILDQLLAEKGSHEVSAQYFNEPLPEGSAVFKRPIRYYNEIGEGAAHYGAFDPATSDKKDSCDAVVLSAAMNRSNQICVDEYKAFAQKNPNEMFDKMFSMAMIYKWKKLAVETNGGQEIYVKLIQEEQRKRNVFFEIVPIHHTRDKTSRIQAMQGRHESGNLLLKQGMSELEDQMLRFPVAAKNDIVDALATAHEIAEPQYETKSRAYYPDKHRRLAA